MATVAINGVNLAFNQANFDQLATSAGAKFGNKIFKSELDGLRTVLTRVAPPVQRQEILYALNQMQMAKREKYADAIDYLVFHWPDLVLPGDITAVAAPGAGYGTTFAQEYALMLPGHDNLDLVYGSSVGRGLPPYTGLGARICDNFNNAADIGTGLAFNRAWQGIGTLDATPASATAIINATTAVGGPVQGITQATRQAHVTSLMASRYNPTAVFAMSNAKIKKDTHLSRGQVQAANNLNPGDRRIERHFWAHARMVKAVRRSCKGGIAMVASSMAYRAVNAKVHFALDALGDLGAVAMKMPLPGRGDYVAITSSELCFCNRYWNDPVYPLSNIVKFYVNGDRVMAPWEGDWVVNDFQGNPVTSNQEAWRRYELARSIRSRPKPFPVF